MKIKLILVAILFFGTEVTINAQKALPIQLNAFLAKVHVPSDSREGFLACTKDTDATNKMVSFKDAGPVMNKLQQTITNYMTQLSSASMSSSYSNTTASMPSANQMSQIQQNAAQMQSMSPDQAMKMAQQMQHGTTVSPTNNPALMQEIGEAQDAAAKANAILGELNNKAVQLGGEFDQQEEKIKMTGTCQEFKVKGADLALPKCGCVKSNYLSFHQKRVAVADVYIKKLNAVLQKYLPDLKNKIGIIDKLEKDSKYGDAFGMPVLKQQAISFQQLAIGNIASILGIVSRAIENTAPEYAELANIENDHLPETCQ